MNIAQEFPSNNNEIIIYSYSSDSIIVFKAFLTNFEDKHVANWGSQEIYGRMDPIYTYKNTNRKISISFDVPSYDLEESKQNYDDINNLMDGLYPTYFDGKGLGDATISSPPMFRIRFSNLVTTDSQSEIKDKISKGLLGWIDSVTFSPALESGFFVSGSEVYPKLYKTDISYNIVHDVDLGEYLQNTPKETNSTANIDKNKNPATKKDEAKKASGEKKVTSSETAKPDSSQPAAVPTQVSGVKKETTKNGAKNKKEPKKTGKATDKSSSNQNKGVKVIDAKEKAANTIPSGFRPNYI